MNDKMVFENDFITFVRKKDYIFKRWLTPGGTGQTVLIYDDTIDEFFVCKKFSPNQEEDVKDKCFKYFVDEVKILYSTYHANVVRIYNHYLYMDSKNGYIIMEYIEGENIDLYLEANPEKINDIFLQVIEGFQHLETIGILHRDIKPNNILVSTKDNLVKIIDFGFGKKVETNEELKTNLRLNWNVNVTELPSELNNNVYDFSTDLFFIGKLFKNIINNSKNVHFKYTSILQDMIELNQESRIKSFKDIKYRITSDTYLIITDDEKEVYNKIAGYLTESIEKLYEKSEFDFNDESVLLKLDDFLKKVIWEKETQNIRLFINCFFISINCSCKDSIYNYYNNEYMGNYTINTDDIRSFYQIFKSFDKKKRVNLLDNLFYNRIENIKINLEMPSDELNDNEIPF